MHYLYLARILDNLPQATKAIKPILGEYYNYDSTVRRSSLLLISVLKIFNEACNIRPVEIVHTMHICRRRRRRFVLQKSVWKRVD